MSNCDECKEKTHNIDLLLEIAINLSKEIARLEIRLRDFRMDDGQLPEAEEYKKILTSYIKTRKKKFKS